jgi:hypothetical protein
VIVNKASKVYGPSIKNFNEAWDVLGLMNWTDYESYGKIMIDLVS